VVRGTEGEFYVERGTEGELFLAVRWTNMS